MALAQCHPLEQSGGAGLLEFLASLRAAQVALLAACARCIRQSAFRGAISTV
jgi:hypothetical protein